MKHIPLWSKKGTRHISGYAIVDDEDYGKVTNIRWYKKSFNKNLNYACGCIWNKEEKVIKQRLKMHRFILDVPAEMVVDHINGNGLDNRKSNLRICTQQQNIFNARPRKSYAPSGVCWSKREKRWKTYIMKDGKTRHLGTYKDKSEAINIRKQAEKELFVEYAHQN